MEVEGVSVGEMGRWRCWWWRRDDGCGEGMGSLGDSGGGMVEMEVLVMEEGRWKWRWWWRLRGLV